MYNSYNTSLGVPALIDELSEAWDHYTQICMNEKLYIFLVHQVTYYTQNYFLIF